VDCSVCGTKITVKDVKGRIRILDVFRRVYVNRWKIHPLIQRLKKSINGHSLGKLCAGCLELELNSSFQGVVLL